MSWFVPILAVVAPFAVIGVLMSIIDRARARRVACVARQIALTDAIHRELGAVAAPEVSGGARGRFLVHMRVPLQHAGLVGSLAGVAKRAFASFDGPAAPAIRLVLEDCTNTPRRVETSHRAGADSREPTATRRLHAA